VAGDVLRIRRVNTLVVTELRCRCSRNEVEESIRAAHAVGARPFCVTWIQSETDHDCHCRLDADCDVTAHSCERNSSRTSSSDRGSCKLSFHRRAHRCRPARTAAGWQEYSYRAAGIRTADPPPQESPPRGQQG